MDHADTESKQEQQVGFTTKIYRFTTHQSSKMLATEFWNNLCGEIKKTGNISENSSSIKLMDWILEHCKHPFKKGERFYRARLITKDEVKRGESLADYEKGLTGVHGFCALCSGAPPADKAEAQRCSREKEVVLYLSSTPEGACVEMRPRLWQFISVASFVLSEDVTVVDWSIRRLLGNQAKILEVIKSIYNANNIPLQMTEATRWEFISHIGEAFRKPGSDDELQKMVYPITQSISDYVRRKNLDGLMYSGIAEKDSFSLALFDTQKAFCDCTYGEIFHHIASASTFSSISKMKCSENGLLPNIITANAEYEPWDFDRIKAFRDLGL